MGNPVVHFEIGCKDKAAAAKFYSELFGWEIDSGPMGRIRTHPPASMGPPPNAPALWFVDGHLTSLGHEPHHYTLFYVRVDDIPACIAQAQSLGGKMLVPEVPLPGGNSAFAWIADHEGNTIGLYRDKG